MTTVSRMVRLSRRKLRRFSRKKLIRGLMARCSEVIAQSERGRDIIFSSTRTLVPFFRDHRIKARLSTCTSSRRGLTLNGSFARDLRAMYSSIHILFWQIATFNVSSACHSYISRDQMARVHLWSLNFVNEVSTQPFTSECDCLPVAATGNLLLHLIARKHLFRIFFRTLLGATEFLNVPEAFTINYNVLIYTSS